MQAVVFVLRCPACDKESRWFRSAAAQVTLNPNRWGRLCGEQEDLRAALAQYLGVPRRWAVPLDWDHVWSETQGEDAVWVPNQGPGDAPAADFAARLDEGIGAWTHVLAISDDPTLTADVSDEYLRCAADGAGGRADAAHAADMPRFRRVVEEARGDATGRATQAKTCNGHVLRRAGWTAAEVTAVLRKAVADYGRKEWWDFGESLSRGCG